ncbi:MAG: hypothetical protein ACRD0O_16785 [Acidimicrobiia bacterium]
MGGLDPAERRRWAQALTGRGDATLWINDGSEPVTNLGLTPEMVDSMVVRAADLDLARGFGARPLEHVQAAVEPAPGAFALQEAFARWRHASARAAEHAGEVRRLGPEWVRTTVALTAPVLTWNDQEKVEAARLALERTATELAVARHAHREVTVSAENVATVHRLHAEVIRAEDQAAHSRLGARARQRLAAALEEEATFLHGLGVSSYTAFLLDDVDRLAGGDTARRLEEAEQAAAEAEGAWRAVAWLEAQTRQRVQLERQAAAIRKRVADMMGTDPAGDVGAILETWPERVPAVMAARAAFEAALEAAGVDPGPDAARAAEKWLAQWSGIGPGTDPAFRSGPEGSDADRLEMYLLGRLTAHDGGDGAGFLPIVFDEALAALPESMCNLALAVIQRAAARVQIIYLTAETDEPLDVDVADALAATEVSLDLSDRAVAPRPDAIPAPEGALCVITCYAPAVDVCEQCHQALCERHAVRVRPSARTLCQSCALAVGGISMARRRR